MPSPIAITLGDINGIGHEITIKSLSQFPAKALRQFVAIGSLEASKRAIKLCSSGLTRDLKSIAINKLSDLKNLPDMSFGIMDVENPLITAGKMAINKEVSGIVTAPVSKGSLPKGIGGQTELFAKMDSDFLGKQVNPVMLMKGDNLMTVPFTRHIPISQVSQSLDIDNFTDQVRIVANSLNSRKFGDLKGKMLTMAICGLNPHAGEGGRIGREEIEILQPFCDSMQKEAAENGYRLDGLLATDSAFSADKLKKYDVFFCPTHDQALIPVKILSGTSCVNITLGLSFFRCSPGHGTAEEIAWQGLADEKGMLKALQLAYNYSCKN